MIGALGNLLKIFFGDRTSFRFAIGVCMGLAFSISIILATIGIMDGFEVSLKKGLKRSMGDIVFYSRSGFFEFIGKPQSVLKNLGVADYSPFVRTEGFLIFEGLSKGIQVIGIDEESYSKVTGIGLKFNKDEVAVGIELAKQLNIKIGDKVVLGLASGNSEFKSLSLLLSFKVGQIVEHGIYQKDLRLFYLDRAQLQEALGFEERVNMVALNVPGMKGAFGENSDYTGIVKLFQRNLANLLGINFRVKPFWKEFPGLIEAVKVEKLIIALILQLVVVISIFNVIAYIFFINELRSREIFLFKALGMGQKMLNKAWISMIFSIWVIACVLSVGFVKIIDYSLLNLPFLKMPGDVYYIGRFSIMLDSFDYILVFFSALVWIILISLLGLNRIRRKSILQGLRKEFA